MGDEEIIRRRLLFDGEGTGDERRLNVLLKGFLAWCNSTDSVEETQASYARMIGQIAQCEFAATKSLRCCEMNTAEQQHYDDLYNQIEEGIVSAKKDIEATKKELQEARQIRRNKMEYDALAAIIQTQPDRRSNQEKLSLLRQELEASECECHKMEAKLEQRRKQFHLLISTIQGLQQLLNDDEAT
ncbi:hypothetical protein DAPPUDRAFT_201659 [Daphnia pulex]|uniref:THO complex subunit 7 homolog n=1 Tax=Daphnia pulex TaxID=6669 RepID=E9H9Y7_DAPPU|nr:hypothetical protein DAPPUDRAFT_201659 [Daphnia pulex]|eukprot:EFX71485.1 hypothetical protein DAPPUDRAFT_201659 [Daphnia pulex]